MPDTTQIAEVKAELRPSRAVRRLLGWLALLLAVAAVVVASIAVGYLGPKKGFQWELASLFGTALGTTLLATATGALAYSTRSDVRATWQLAELTKRDQDARERPVVLQKVASWAGGGESGGRQDGQLTITLMNVGLGPALNVEITASYDDDEYEPVIATGLHSV